MMKTNIDVRNSTVVRRAGLLALIKELGIVGATYFLRQYSFGQGDYTKERVNLLQEITMDEIVTNVRKLDAQKA